MKVEVSDDEYEVIKALRRFRNSVEEAIKDEILEAKSMKILTEDERVLLRNIKNEEYNGIIGREDDKTYQVGKLYLKNKYSGAKAFAFSTLYNHLFQFIKERRRIFY